MQQVPNGWTPNDLGRFNSFLDVLSAYQALDYVRGKVGNQLPPAMAQFLSARQADIGALVQTMAQQFQGQFGQE